MIQLVRLVRVTAKDEESIDHPVRGRTRPALRKLKDGYIKGDSTKHILYQVITSRHSQGVIQQIRMHHLQDIQ